MDNKKRIEFIINPVSGGIRVLPIKSAIEHLIDSNLYEYGFTSTTHKGHATELAKNFAAKESTYMVVAVGGDGTVNEVGCGLIDTNMPMLSHR